MNDYISTKCLLGLGWRRSLRRSCVGLWGSGSVCSASELSFAQSSPPSTHSGLGSVIDEAGPDNQEKKVGHMISGQVARARAHSCYCDERKTNDDVACLTTRTRCIKAPHRPYLRPPKIAKYCTNIIINRFPQSGTSKTRTRLHIKYPLLAVKVVQLLMLKIDHSPSLMYEDSLSSEWSSS